MDNSKDKDDEYWFGWRLLLAIGKLPTWVFIVVLIMGLYQYGHWTNNIIEKKLAVPATWLSEYYKEFPIGGGWTIRKISAKKRIVTIYVLIPQAYKMMEDPFRSRRAALHVVCPSKLEEVWKLLPPKAAIWVTGLTPAGDAFIDVGC